MLPTTTNHHSLIEPSWKSYYDAKKLIRQTEQRLQDATTRGHQPFTSHHHHHHYEIGAATGDDSNLLSPSSSFLLHGDSSSIHAGNRSMLGDERSSSTTTTSKHQLLDSEALQTIRRKISKQKIAAERRAEQLLHSQSDAGHMFESYRSRNPHHNYSTSASLQNLHYSPQRHQHTSPLNHHHHHHHPVPLPSSHLSQSQSFPTELDAVLRHSAGSRMLHGDNDAIRSNDFDRQTFHQPNTRKITKIMPKENYSLSNGRPPPQQQQRSASASTGPANKYHDLPSSHFLTPNEVQRLKHVRRLEPAHVPSVPGAKTSLITPESWRADHPVSTTSKKVIPQEKMTTTKKSTVTEIMIKRTKTDEPREEPTVHVNQRTEKPIKAKRDTSVPKSAEKTTPAKAPPKPKTESEKKRIQDYMLHKRQQHEEALVSEKRSRNEQEKVRREKLKKLNEQIKEVVHQPPILPSKKPSAFTPVTPKDLTEQTRQRLLRLLGPKNISESSPVEFEQSQRVLERSPSSSSLSSSSSSLSSNNSVIEVQPATRPFEPFSIRSRSEPPGHNGITSNGHRRHETLLNWAGNLTRDCDQIENKFKSFRPDGTQPFDIIPPARQQLQHDDGNLRHPIYLANNESDIVPPLSTSLRPSGRLSRLNQNRTTEYQGQQLPGVGDLRDPLLERRIYRDRAAAKIQAAYRGYTVRKSLQWSNDHRRLQSEFNKRPLYKPIARPFSSDLLGSTHVNIDFRFSDDNFTIGSTLLRRYEQNGSAAIPSMNPSESRSIIVPHHHRERQQTTTTTRKPTALNSYSDDYENGTSTTSSAISTPISHKQPPIVTQKPRVIPQPVPKNVSASSSSSSSSSSTTPTPTPEPRVPSLGQHRRSISPPLAPQMSPDNGRLLQPPPPPPPSTVQHRIFDERRYSPDALERQLNAEFHLLDGVEASMKQVDNMERLRSVALAQQEVVSLAQIMKNTPPPPSSHQLQTRKSPVRQTSSTSSSSSSSTNRKRRSPSPPQPPPSVTPHTHVRHRITQNSSPPTSSSESILTAREKRVRQKFNSEVELQAYEKRLKDIEKKIRQLVKRAFEIFDEKRSVSSPPTLLRTKPVVPITNTVPTHVRSKSSNHSSDDSTISEEVPGSHKSSSSTSSAVQRKTTTAVVNDTSEIRTESNIFPHKKDSDTSSISIRQQQQQSGDIVTSDASDIEHRIRAYREQLKVKKTELERLKQRKNKELLRRQEDELKKQIQSYDNEIETLRLQPSQTPSPSVTTRVQRNEQTVPVPSRPSSSSSNSSSSTAAKPVESSIAEDLPVTTTQSKTGLEEKKAATPPPSPPVVVKAPVKERDFFDDDNEEEEEEERKPVETPRDERDTQHDAQSISIATDLAASSAADTDNENDSRRPSIDNEQPILNFNTNMPTSPTEKAVSKDDANVSSSSSSSETTTSKHSKPSPVPQPAPIQQKPSQPQGRSSSISNDYDEDFSEASHSATNIPTKKNGSNVVDDVDIESIQEDLNESRSTRATNRSSSSKSSGDEQSEILVLVKKSASNTPRRPDDKTVEEELPVPPPPPPLPSLPAPLEEKKVEIEKNDDTSHDASEDEEPIEHEQQETKIDTFTDMFIRTFIDEAIDEGKKIQRLKREKIPVNTTTTTPSHLMTKEASEWMSDEDLSDEENNRHTPGQEEDVENDMQILTSQPDFLKQLDTTTNGTAEHDDLKLDLSRLDDKTLDEPRIESPRKLVIEEPVKPVVPHTRDQVLELSHRATTILFDQNRNFADRSTINRSIPESYFPEDQQDSDSEDIRRSRRAYAVMVFDLCVELLHEMYTPNVRQAKYEWQKAQLVSKRYYRANPPQNRVDAERFVQDKVLEILNLAPRQVTYSKWRTPPVRRGGGDQFEVVLDEELRRMEPHWINYDNDCLQIKFDIADIIFDQLFQETLTECLQVVKKRMLQSSSSTRL